uniref:FAS1 domain-containing protein n=1 Tax=Heterorhabditis bacteriophora TaxID=37862 RepID=A0A1I7X6R5_HETBA
MTLVISPSPDSIASFLDLVDTSVTHILVPVFS